MSFLGGGYGGPTRFDDNDPLSGDDGTYDPPLKWIALGIVVPLILVILACVVVILGGVWLPRDNWLMRWQWFGGTGVVAGAVTSMIGVSTIFVARFLMPNVFRESYAYQYVACAGIALCAIGFPLFVIAAVMS
jgi:hypothetical protein